MTHYCKYCDWKTIQRQHDYFAACTDLMSTDNGKYRLFDAGINCFICFCARFISASNNKKREKMAWNSPKQIDSVKDFYRQIAIKIAYIWPCHTSIDCRNNVLPQFNFITTHTPAYKRRQKPRAHFIGLAFVPIFIFQFKKYKQKYVHSLSL